MRGVVATRRLSRCVRTIVAATAAEVDRHLRARLHIMSYRSTRLARFFAAALATIFVTACVAPPEPQRTIQVSNPAYQLDELFTDPNGYTVYRFQDDGDSRYYVVGPGGAQMLPTTRTKYVNETTGNTVYVQTGGHDNHKK
jgi:hypothetical protein